MIPNSANKIVNTTVDITQYINTEYFNVNNGVAYLIKIGKLRMIKVDVTLKKAITKDTYIFNFPSNFLKGMINTYFFGNVINRNGKAYEVAFYNQLASNNFSILLQVTAGNTIEHNSRLIGEWTGFCSADINDISEEENKFITYNQFNTLISETLKDYIKKITLEESQAQQDKLIQKLQNNTIQESTEEATNLHVKDASDLPAKLNIRGNHYQEVKNSINELHLIDTEETSLANGLTYKIEDETLTINGSVSSAYGLVITDKSNIVDLIKTNEKWTLSVYGENMPDTNTFIRITTASNNNALQAVLTSSSLENDNSATFIENSTTVRIMIAANAVYNDTKIKIKLEKGSTKTAYDKYCKMPSVYTPSEIETLKNNIKIIQCNSNFLKKQEETETTGQGLTGKVLADGTITLNGTTTNDTYIQITDELKIADYNVSKNYEKHVLPKREL